VTGPPTPPRREPTRASKLPSWMVDTAPRDYREADSVSRRRRTVVAATSVAGAGLLGASLSTEPDSTKFYALTLGVAGTWLIGGLRSGPLHLGWAHTRHGTLRRPVIEPIATGAAAFGIFYGAARLARHVPILNQATASVLEYAHRGSRPLILATTLANGVGEEVFFRGAVYAAAGNKYPVPKSTAVYTLAATATRNPALVLASGLMGALFARQRRASGGIQASILTHLTWSTLMLRYLPPLFPDITTAATRSGD
jgi:membrane protease YdiL (CAAX protease family)